jgi:subtilisin-like proprotein convertase family protein
MSCIFSNVNPNLFERDSVQGMMKNSHGLDFLVRRRSLLAAWAACVCLSSSAALFQFNSGEIRVAIPDANLTGWSSTVVFSDLPRTIQNVSVNLQISGGYNGDLYAYLWFDGKMVPLLNRVGVGSGSTFGSSTQGMNITLADGDYINVHDASSEVGPLTGTYNPDGRAISPLSAKGEFDANQFGSADLVKFSTFSGKNPNGAWTVFFADTAGGDQSQLVSWGLEINAVPEPANVALGICGLVFGAHLLWNRRSGRLTRS